MIRGAHTTRTQLKILNGPVDLDSTSSAESCCLESGMKYRKGTTEIHASPLDCFLLHVEDVFRIWVPFLPSTHEERNHSGRRAAYRFSTLPLSYSRIELKTTNSQKLR